MEETGLIQLSGDVKSRSETLSSKKGYGIADTVPKIGNNRGEPKGQGYSRSVRALCQSGEDKTSVMIYCESNILYRNTLQNGKILKKNFGGKNRTLYTCHFNIARVKQRPTPLNYRRQLKIQRLKTFLK